MADLDRSQLIYLVALNFGKGLMLRGVNLSNVDMRGLIFIERESEPWQR